MNKKIYSCQLLLSVMVISGSMFLQGFKRDDPTPLEMLTSTWWTLTGYCVTSCNCGESCILGFHRDGSCTEEDYYSGFYSWKFKDNHQILELNSEDYKIIGLTEDYLKFKRNWLLGCSYTYRSIIISPAVKTLGVSDLTQTSATIYGHIKSDKETLGAKIEYGSTTSYGSKLLSGMSTP